MTNAPTTRETADHAELARLAEAANVEMPSKKRSGWYRDRSAFTHAANPARVLALLSEIAALRGERDERDARLTKATENMANIGALYAGAAFKLGQAERQRDELRKAVEAICLEASRPGMKPQHLLRVIAVATTPVRALLANQGADQ